MAVDKTKHTSILVNFPDQILEDIETYQFDNRIQNRTQTIIRLIEKGLEKEESE